MIRHADGSNAAAICAQAKRGHVYAVVWTWRKHRVVLTKTDGRKVMKAWRRWYERKGWKVVTRGEGYVAYAPDYDVSDYNVVGPDSKLHSVGLHDYDVTTRERVYPEYKPPKPRAERPLTPKPRRGRKPVGA